MPSKGGFTPLPERPGASTEVFTPLPERRMPSKGVFTPLPERRMVEYRGRYSTAGASVAE